MAANPPMNTYEPDVVSAPGETLAEVLEERDMSQRDLADRLGLATPTLSKIINGRAPISQKTALGLERVLGIPAGFWNRYEAAYRESLARQEERLSRTEWLDWARQFPWSEAVKFGWGEPAEDVDLVERLLQFFGVASPEQYAETYAKLAVNLRESPKFKSDAAHLAMWLRQGERQAADIDCAPYNKPVFKEALKKARSLTTVADPKVFVPQLQDTCRACGVAVVFVPELSKTHVSGATRWLSRGAKALIQLSVRYKTNDSLWFTFFHEAAHILKHSRQALFLEDAGQTGDRENEANSFAADLLIPPREFRTFRSRPQFPKRAIEEFAHHIGIAPGIVIGRLQKDRLLRWDTRLNSLKRRYKWAAPGN